MLGATPRASTCASSSRALPRAAVLARRHRDVESENVGLEPALLQVRAARATPKVRRRAARADARARATSCEIEHESRTNRCAARTDACAAAASALSAHAGAMRNAGVGSCTGVGTCAGVGSRVGIGSRVNVGSCVSVISCRLARLVLARPRALEPSACPVATACAARAWASAHARTAAVSAVRLALVLRLAQRVVVRGCRLWRVREAP